jgi:hypothetical protein
MVISGEKKNTRISLDNNPLFFHIVIILLQIIFVTNGEIFQARAVEGDVLLRKPFLVLGFNGIVRWKSQVSYILLSLLST